MKRKSRFMRTIVLLLIVFATISSCVISAGAIGFVGSSTTGGVPTSSQSGKYGIPGSTMQCLVGYRFAAIKANGQLANPRKESLDVFIKERESYLDSSSSKSRMVPQYSKKRYFDTFADVDDTAPSTYLDASSDIGAVGFARKESAMGFATALPGRSTSDLAAALNKWQGNNNNLNIIAKALGYTNGINSMATNDTITIEPIFEIKIDNEWTCLTVTEMAIYGGLTQGFSYKSSSKDANSWGFIGNYTNRHFGNTLYTDFDNDERDIQNVLGWNTVSTGATSRQPFYKMITYGYGVGICYQRKDSRPDLECVNIYFIDANKNIYSDPMKLPAGTTVYAIGVFANNGAETKYGNVYMKKNSSSTALTSSQMSYMTSCSPYADLNYSYLSGTFSTSGTKHKSLIAPRYPQEYVLTKLTGSSGTTGYVHAQVWLNGYTSATTTTTVESNIANNYKKVQYKFVGDAKHDVGIEVLLTDSKGPIDGKIYTDTEMKSLKYGSVVQVWHKYSTNSGASYPSSEYVNGYDDASSNSVKLNGSNRILVTKGEYTYALISAFRANSFSNVTRYGYVTLANASWKTYSGNLRPNTDRETNAANNSDSITWKALCDVELYQIILEQLDASGNVVNTWTRTQGKTETKPNIPYGATVRIKYVYRNNSLDVLKVDGYKSTTINTSNKIGSAYEVYANSGTKMVTYGTFTASASGRVYGAVRVNGYTGTGIESNANNNSLSFGYTVAPPKDLAVKQVRYVYKYNGKEIEEVVPNGSTIVPKFPYGVTVSVYYTFQNTDDTTLNIDGYWTQGSGTRTLISASDNYELPAGTQKEFFVKNFTASTLGNGSFTAEVYENGKTTATGETNTTNNKQASNYMVFGYDVGILDIYFVDEDGNVYGEHSSSVELDYGKTYDIYYTVKNNGTESAVVHIYDNVDPTAEGALRVTQYTNGAFLAPGQSSNLYAGKLAAENQVIGENSIDGSVFIGENTSTSFTWSNFTGVELNVNNNTRVETVTLKHDVAITDIYHSLLNGTRLDEFVPADIPVDIHYVVKNNSNAPVKVNVYYESEYDPDNLIKVQKNGTYVVVELAAGEEVDIIINTVTYRIGHDGYTFWGHVYRDGQTPQRDLYEKTFTNNVLEESVHVIEVPYLEAIAPNAEYRVGTDVITSFYLHNPTDYDYTGLSNGRSLEVTFTVRAINGTVLYTTKGTAVVPANCEGKTFPDNYVRGKNGGAQLVFFKWTMPEEYRYSSVIVEAELNVPRLGIVTSSLSNRRYVCSADMVNTPDTKYEANPPTNWQELVNAREPYDETETKKWYIYYYDQRRGGFIRPTFAYQATAYDTVIAPDTVTSYIEGDKFYMKSGYGFNLYNASGVKSKTGTTLAGYSVTTDMYTSVQYAYVTYQEFGFSTDEGCITTLERVSYRWVLPEYLHYGKRIHFTPIWYPNDGYRVYACYSDIWTPMGMITVAGESNEIQIDEDMYNDWYVGHG